MKGRELYFSLLAKLHEDDEEKVIRLLFDYYLKKNFVNSLEDEISEEKAMNIEKSFTKYQDGYPLEYITNEAYFMGEKYYVDERVLIPRVETEEVVMEALKFMKDVNSFVDLGTGSGIIALSIKRLFPKAKAYAVDISKDALDVFNINKKELEVETYLGDMLEPLIEHNTKVDLIISNPPYIRRSFKVDKRVEKEPSIALYGEDKGTYFYKRIMDNASKVLNENGHIVFEIGYDLKKDLEKLFTNYPYEYEFKKDINGNDRIAILKKC